MARRSLTQRSSQPHHVDLQVLSHRARVLADFLDDEGKRAPAIAARNLARDINTAAADLRRSQLQRVA